VEQKLRDRARKDDRGKNKDSGKANRQRNPLRHAQPPANEVRCKDHIHLGVVGRKDEDGPMEKAKQRLWLGRKQKRKSRLTEGDRAMNQGECQEIIINQMEM